MFTIDKELLKKDVYTRVANYPTSWSHYSVGDPVADAISVKINTLIKDAIDQNVKMMISDVMSHLIDKLYTADDFEKDIGLK